MHACQAPLKQIVSNAGFDGPVVLLEVLESKSSYGFNAQTGKVEDLLAAGVVDPAKVVKYSLMYAASVAEIVLISEALIGDAPEDEEES
jgi:chaperonin GroEL